MALKRKLSSSAQLYEFHQSTSSSSTDADENHQPVSAAGEENEMPTRKRRRMDRSVELRCCDWSGTISDQNTGPKNERSPEDQNSLQYSVCALEDHGLQEPLSNDLEVLPPADQQVQTPSAPMHHSPALFKPVNEESDSQERQRKKSSSGELLSLHWSSGELLSLRSSSSELLSPFWSCSSGQGQKVEDETTATISERHAEDETKRTSCIIGRKRKQSSRSAQVYDSHQSISSISRTNAAENHQPGSTNGEENERPMRKRRRMDSFEMLPAVTVRHTEDALENHCLQEPVVSSGLEDQLVQTPPAPPVHHSPVSPAPGHNNRVDVTTEDNILSRYEIGRKLGKGAFGTVYEGKRLEDGLEVAVKIARKPLTIKYIHIPDHPTPLPLEVGLLILANRGPKVSQIIELLDWQDQPEQYIMVLERPSPCKDLWEFWNCHRGILNEDMARFIMAQTTIAAQMCCHRGVFHRDIKLENILINTKTLEVKLIDFGCGDLLQESAYERFLGTINYRPPEYCTEGKYYGEPATVWSLGVLLFLLVCGRFPEPRDKQMIDDDIWSRNGLSNECCLLIRSLLKDSPRQRICLRNILQHEWFNVMSLRSATNDLD